MTKLPCTEVALHCFKTFSQHQLQTGLSEVYDGVCISMKTQVIQVLLSYYFHKHLGQVLQSSITESSFKIHSKRVRSSSFLLTAGSRRRRKQVNLSVRGVVYVLLLCKKHKRCGTLKSPFQTLCHY